MDKHFTATVYIFWQDRVLLHHHEKLNKYMPPGGHLEPNETPSEAALREVKEETALDVFLIEQENLHVKARNAVSIPRPFLCLLENVPAFKDKSAHQHIDMIYLAKLQNPENGNKVPKPFQWYSYTEIESMDQENFFPDTLQVLSLILKEKKFTICDFESAHV